MRGFWLLTSFLPSFYISLSLFLPYLLLFFIKVFRNPSSSRLFWGERGDGRTIDRERGRHKCIIKG